MEFVSQRKDQGNEAFKAGNFSDATKAYNECLDKLLAAENGIDEPTQGVQVALMCNLAACALKQEQFEECVAQCTTALGLDAKCLKAFFRRAQAYGAIHKFDLAVKDLHALLSLDPNNKAARQLMLTLKDKATEISSTKYQMLERLKNPSDNPAERLKQLREILGALNEDASLGKQLVQGKGHEMLWALVTEEPFAALVLAKLSENPDIIDHIRGVVQFEDVASWVLDEQLEPKYSAASLTLLHHVFEAESTRDAEKTNLFSNTLSSAIESKRAMVSGTGLDTAIKHCTSKERVVEFINAGGMEALLTTLSPEKDSRQRVAVVLGRILPLLENDDQVQKYALQFCRPLMKAREVHDNIRGIAALNSIFFANNELGMTLVQEPDMMGMLLEFAKSAPSNGQNIVVDIFAHMANSEKGRAILGGPPQDLLQALVHSDNPGVRSGAAVTLTKLNAVDFDADSAKGMMVLSSVLELLQPSASVEEKAKGVEAISFVVTDTDVKEMICMSSNTDILKQLIELANEKETTKHSYAFGLSYIFENLTMNEDDKKREKLREMDVTQEQWEQFEKITKSQTRKSGKKDLPENVNNRIQSFLHVGGASALRAMALSDTASGKVLESLAKTYCNCATVQTVRGSLIAQGAIRALLKLVDVDTSGDDKNNKNKKDRRSRMAAHAIAKILITTDPHLVPESQLMDAMAPMVTQVRYSDEDLVIFECLMALTNLSTISQETKKKQASLKAIPAFEYAQFSDNVLVRRAATEAMNNLVPTEEIRDWIAMPEKMKLWLLLAEDLEGDELTAQAACGALANLSFDEKVAETLVKGNGVNKMTALLDCGNVNIVHRVLVLFTGLLASYGKDAKAAMQVEGTIDKVQSVSKSTPSEAAVQCAKSLIEAYGQV